VFFIIPIIISDLFQHNTDLPLWQDWILESSFVPGFLLLHRIARAFVVLDDRNGLRSSSFPVLADLFLDKSTLFSTGDQILNTRKSKPSYTLLHSVLLPSTLLLSSCCCTRRTLRPKLRFRRLPEAFQQHDNLLPQQTSVRL
jgi:hypothetical protein